MSGVDEVKRCGAGDLHAIRGRLKCEHCGMKAAKMVILPPVWRQYLDGFDNLLVFSAWPMLAACFTLYLLREYDVLLSVDHARST